jgi:hypothetical protein
MRFRYEVGGDEPLVEGFGERKRIAVRTPAA